MKAFTALYTSAARQFLRDRMAILFTVLLPLLMAGLAKSNESVVAIGQVVQFPMMLLSGVLFPLEMLPDFLRPVSAAIPLTYPSDGLKAVDAGPAPLHPLWVACTVLGGLLVVLATLSVRFFRWE